MIAGDDIPERTSTALAADAATVQATLFTDPLCCWSYAMHHSIESVMLEYGKEIQWRIRVAGMIPDWKKFHDPVNNVTRPLQMGPLWMYVADMLQFYLDSSLWIRDAPVSSYPACLAYHAAILQHHDYGWPFLKLLWQCCMKEGQNISDRKSLLTVAKRFGETHPTFDPVIFEHELNASRSRRLFQDDISATKAYGITRLPSIVIKGPVESLLLTGYRPGHIIREAVLKVLSHM